MVLDSLTEAGWKKTLEDEFAKPYFSCLQDLINKEREEYVLFPPPDMIFNAFNLTPFESVKVVILGQDPYHGSGQAHGLAFSVPCGIDFPPSLRNIFKELGDDVGCDFSTNGDLTSWAMQGVLLLNTLLSVRSGEPFSHKNCGWEKFTDQVIRTISAQLEHVVFILWGAHAGKKSSLIDETKHLILKSPHPSPLSSYRGFFGSKPFSQTNDYLVEQGIAPIEWCISSER